MTALPLAHGGAGASWQALVVVAAAALAIVFVLAVLGRVRLDAPGDLALPLAGVAIVSAVGPTFGATLSDHVAWALPAGAVVLAALVVATFTPLRLTPTSPLTWLTVALAVVLALTLRPALTRSLHPAAAALPSGEGIVLMVAEPPDGASVAAGPVTVSLAIDGGTIAAEAHEHDDEEDAHADGDPAALGTVRLFLDGAAVEGSFEEDCPASSPCTSVSYVVDLAPGEHRLVAEFVTETGTPFSPPVTASVDLVAE